MTQQPYIVGKFYRVPCVLARITTTQVGPLWWPVLGPKHEDIEHIGFEYEHYHIDARFVSRRLLEQVPHPQKFFAVVVHDPYIYSRPETRTRMCHRAQPAYPDYRLIKWTKDLNAAYANKTLANRICPHRGADLSTFAPDEDGCITCPLHGLRWDAETGKCRPVELPPDRREAFRKASAERHGIQTQGAQQ